MKIEATPLEGVFTIAAEPLEDDRGHFARIFCEREFRENGLDAQVSQASISYNRFAGTLRGVHIQRAPHGETKIIRCIRGSAFDVAVDLRPESPTYGSIYSTVLKEEEMNAVIVTPGIGHGFLTLEDGCTILYQMSVPYDEAASTGVKWDDPDLGIPWPLDDAPRVSDRDRALPSFSQYNENCGPER